MKETKFTPGPWKREHKFIFTPGEEGCNVAAVGSPRASTHVSYTELMATDPDIQEAIANAHLISAAPDMYEALLDAQQQIEYLHHKFQETGTGNKVLAVISAALNKANP